MRERAALMPGDGEGDRDREEGAGESEKAKKGTVKPPVGFAVEEKIPRPPRRTAIRIDQGAYVKNNAAWAFDKIATAGGEDLCPVKRFSSANPVSESQGI